MHQLIRVLVPGTTEDDALAHAHSALDALIGIGMDNTPVFDYYKTYEETDARFRPYVANVISDGNPEHVDEKSLPPGRSRSIARKGRHSSTTPARIKQRNSQRHSTSSKQNSTTSSQSRT